MTCLDENTILGFIDGSLGAAEQDGACAHIDACADCRQLVASCAPAIFGEPRAGAGQRVGRYLILAPLAAGGMGVVYEAYDPELDRKVAIKVLHRALGDASERMREAQALARLAHPNVVTVFDAGLVGDRPFVAMELVAGETLTAWLAREPRPWREVRRAFMAAGEGLAAAHAAGLVHRDFKPDNVLVGADGRVRVTDFGLARALPVLANPGRAADHVVATRATYTESVTGLCGTPAYMAPEQLRGQRADAASDQFAFCVAMWEAMFGRRPFAGESVAGLEQAIRSGRAPEPPVATKVPARVVRTLRRGLSADAAARFAGMPALLAALGRKPAWARRRAILAAAAVALALAGWVGYGQAGRLRAISCRGAARELDKLWDREAVARLPGLDPAAAARTNALADRFVADWTFARVDACEATRVRGEQSESLLDRRLRCLRTQRDELAALSSLLLKGTPAVLEHATDAAARLPSPSACSFENMVNLHVPPPTADHVAEIERLDEQVARARALHNTGQFAEGLRTASLASERLHELDYAPLGSEADAVRGALEERLGHYAAAEGAFFESYGEAYAAGDDSVAAKAATYEAFVLGVKLGRPDEGLRWAKLARAALARQPPSAERLGFLELVIGQIEDGAGHYDLGTQHLARAIELTRTLPDTGRLGHMYASLGIAYRRMHKLPEARLALESAVAEMERSAGPKSPELAPPIASLANVAMDEGRYADAAAGHRRAVELTLARLGPAHADLASYRSNLALDLIHLGRTAEAIDEAARAVAIQERVGPDQPNMIAYLVNQAEILLAAGRAREALPPALRAVALADVQAAPGTHAAALTTLGGVLRASGQLREAVARYREAIAADSTPDGSYALPARIHLGVAKLDLGHTEAARDALIGALSAADAAPALASPGLIGEGEHGLARALWATGDRAGALRAASRARSALAQAGSGEAPALASIDRWLAAHRDADD
jgi:serine/threonine protein kinase